MVLGWSAGVAAAAAAVVPNPLDISPSMMAASLRISLSPSVGQAELNPHAGRRIHRLAVPLCRLELDFLRGSGRRLIEAVAESADNAIDLNGTVAQKDQIEHHVPLDSQAAPFRGVLRMRFGHNVDHRSRGVGGRGSLLRSVGRDSRVGKSGALHCAMFAAARRRIRYAISKTGARDRAADALVPSGLHFVQRQVNRRWSRAARVQVVDLHFVLRALGLINGCVELGFKNGSRGYLGSLDVELPDLRLKRL